TTTDRDARRDRCQRSKSSCTFRRKGEVTPQMAESGDGSGGAPPSGRGGAGQLTPPSTHGQGVWASQVSSGNLPARSAYPCRVGSVGQVKSPVSVPSWAPTS